MIVHVGYALARLDPEEAERTLALFAEAGLDGGVGGVKYIDEFRDGGAREGAGGGHRAARRDPIAATT